MLKTLLYALALHGSTRCSAARNKVWGSSSAAQSIGTVGSILQQHGYSSKMLDSLLAGVGQRETPGVESSMREILDTVVAELEKNVEAKIKAAHNSTQSALKTAIDALSDDTAEALREKATADAADEAWFTCTRTEKAQLEEVEAAAKAVEESTRSAVAPCQEQQDRGSTPFSSELNPGTFVCDLSMGTCEAQLNAYTSELQAEMQSLEAEMHSQQSLYDAAKRACDASQADIIEKESIHSIALAAFEAQKTRCMQLHESRQVSICLFGSTLQGKCEKVDAFRTLTGHVQAVGGGDHSQPDRLAEWKTVAVTKCMISDVSAGVALDGNSLKACEASVDYKRDVGSLDMYEGKLQSLTSAESFTCTETTIPFLGQTWEVPAGATSSQYSVVSHQPAFDVSNSEAPFDFCGVSAPSAPSAPGKA